MTAVPLFQYDAAIVERYPTVVGGALHATATDASLSSWAVTANTVRHGLAP